MLTVISCNWAPGEAGNISGQILEKTPVQSEARETIFEHFRGKRLCERTERTERYFFNGLQIRPETEKPKIIANESGDVGKT